MVAPEYRIVNHTKKEYIEIDLFSPSLRANLLVSWPYLLLSEPEMRDAQFYRHEFQVTMPNGDLLPPFADAIRPIKGRWHKDQIAYETSDPHGYDQSMESILRNAMYDMLGTNDEWVDWGGVWTNDAENGYREVGPWSNITHEVIVAHAAYKIAMNVNFGNPFDNEDWRDIVGAFTPIEALRLLAVETLAKQGTKQERLARYKERRAAPAKAFAARGAAGTLPMFAQEYYDRRHKP